MGKGKERSPEEQERRARIRELLQLSGVSAKAFRRNGTIAIALILVLAIGAAIARNVFSQSLDTYVNRNCESPRKA